MRDATTAARTWFPAPLTRTNGLAAARTGTTTFGASTGRGEVLEWGSRIALAYSKSSPNIVYATSAADSKVYKSTDGGKSYAAVTTSGTTDTNWYCAPLWVDPTNPSIVRAGG